MVVEYAKASPNDVLVRVTVENRGPERGAASLAADTLAPEYVVLGARRAEAAPGPGRRRRPSAAVVRVEHPELSPDFRFYAEGAPRLLFTENETNVRRLFGDGQPDAGRKGAFHEALVHGREELLLAGDEGTKVAAHYRLTIPAGGRTVLRLRLVDGPAGGAVRARSSKRPSPSACARPTSSTRP